MFQLIYSLHFQQGHTALSCDSLTCLATRSPAHVPAQENVQSQKITIGPSLKKVLIVRGWAYAHSHHVYRRHHRYGRVTERSGSGRDMRGWLRRLIEDAHLDSSLFSFTELDPLIDSSNATPDNWQTMADDLRAHRDDADAFVVLHGTDTMSYSSAALSYALTDFGKPVIFTGSQHPLGKIESDATANVTGALTPR
mgnify:CR=1 FL=1